MIRPIWVTALLVLASGCGVLPRRVHQPTFHNPFPQLTKVAIAPFFNLSAEPTVDGRQFALAYYNELQLVQGFEVVPLGVVEKALETHRLSLGNPAEVRKLAQILDVEAVVVGAVTDFSPYYPPRCGLRVEWYAANPGFHPIPAGYGLPWGTAEEEFIPKPLVLEAEMALAREQLKTQAPLCDTRPLAPLPNGRTPPMLPTGPEGQDVSHEAPLPDGAADAAGGGTIAAAATGLPADWPDPRGFMPLGPSAERPECLPSDEPVMRHTRTYNGHDADLTAALSSYVLFRDDARFGGWQSYLQRSDDFIRFCCHKHIAEMLTARGGAGETRVVWRWPDRR